MQDPHNTSSPLDALVAHYAAMPPVAALQPQVMDWHEGRLRLSAPLAANVNDKGCAFGGSLASLMTLAAWGLVFLELSTQGIEADIFVADSRVRYLKPVFEDLRIEAGFDDPGEHAALAETLRRLGRAVLEDGGIAATFVGRYVAIRKQ